MHRHSFQSEIQMHCARGHVAISHQVNGNKATADAVPRLLWWLLKQQTRCFGEESENWEVLPLDLVTVMQQIFEHNARSVLSHRSKGQDQLQCPSVEEIPSHKHDAVNACRGMLLHQKRNGILAHVVAWMNLEGSMPMKEADTEGQVLNVFSYGRNRELIFFFLKKKYKRDDQKLGRRMRNSRCLRIYKFLFIKQLYKLVPWLHNAMCQANDIRMRESPLVCLFGLRVS